MVYTRSQFAATTQLLRSSIVSTKGLLNGPGQNNCFLNCAVQVSRFQTSLFFLFKIQTPNNLFSREVRDEKQITSKRKINE